MGFLNHQSASVSISQHQSASVRQLLADVNMLRVFYPTDSCDATGLPTALPHCTTALQACVNAPPTAPTHSGCSVRAR